jgi:hypothetical protein
MAQADIANMRAFKNMARQDYERQTTAAAGGASGDFSDAGPPYWNPASWEGFKAQYGFYPFGMQNGTMVMPPSFEGAPDWVYEKMNLRKPPVQVTPNA